MGKVSFVNEKVHVKAALALEDLKYDFMDDIDFRLSHDPDHSAAEDLSLGVCIKTYKKATDSVNRRKEIDKIADNHYSGTQIVDYINAGQKGYVKIEAKIRKNRKRGKTYYVANKIPRFMSTSYRKVSYSGFSTKKEAEDYAKQYAISNLEESVYVINEKKEELGEIYLDTKHYKNKPNLAKKSGRAVLPSYLFVMIGTAHVG